MIDTKMRNKMVDTISYFWFTNIMELAFSLDLQDALLKAKDEFLETASNEEIEDEYYNLNDND